MIIIIIGIIIHPIFNVSLYKLIYAPIKYSVITLLGHPYAKQEVITEQRANTSVMFISYAQEDIGVTFDTIAPEVEIVTTVDYVDWEIEKTKYVTDGKITLGSYETILVEQL